MERLLRAVLLLFGGVLAIGAFLRFVQPQPARQGDTAREPREIVFRDLTLDARQLAEDQANVEVDGVYQGVGDTLELLYAPTHTAIGFSDDSVRLMTTNSPRAVRELFYRCRQQNDAAVATGSLTGGCAVRIVGQMGTCYLQINENANFPCLSVGAAVLRR